MGICANSFEIEFDSSAETQIALQKEFAEIYKDHTEIKNYLEEGAVRHGIICDNENLYFEMGDEGYLFIEERGCSYTVYSENPDFEGMGGSGELSYIEPDVTSIMDSETLNDLLQEMEKTHPDFKVTWLHTSFYGEENDYRKDKEGAE